MKKFILLIFFFINLSIIVEHNFYFHLHHHVIVNTTFDSHLSLEDNIDNQDYLLTILSNKFTQIFISKINVYDANIFIPKIIFYFWQPPENL